MSGGETLLDIETHTGPDGQQYVDRQNAALLAGVDPATISTWEARRHLARLEGCPPRMPLYAVDDVIKAELKARQGAERTSGSETRATRRYAA